MWHVVNLILACDVKWSHEYEFPVVLFGGVGRADMCLDLDPGRGQDELLQDSGVGVLVVLFCELEPNGHPRNPDPGLDDPAPHFRDPDLGLAHIDLAEYRLTGGDLPGGGDAIHHPGRQ